MFNTSQNSRRNGTRLTAMAVLVATMFVSATPAAFGAKNKKAEQPAAKVEVPLLRQLDYSKIVWPNPPAITRVKFLDFFANEKYHEAAKVTALKSGWMDRLAGAETQAQKRAEKPLYALWTPYGLAVDSKNRLYVADGRVGAIFIFNTETKEAELIKNNQGVRFGFIIGLAMDDNDRLFVSDSKMHRVLVLNAQHQLETTFSEGMVNPGGMAIDTENRFLYVVDAELDQVLVYDADSFKLLRKIGTTGKKHTLTAPGDFSKPTNVAIDKDGSIYVTDTWNDRVQIFDADGVFIRAFGKNGDAPGRFARPKGIAIDADGHVWVADAAQDRLQCYTPEGKLLMYMGAHGSLPGQFGDLAGLAFDKQNRMFTSEQYPGRVQMFRYTTNPEAMAENDRREAADKKKPVGNKLKQVSGEPAIKPAPAPKDSDTAKKPQ